jgi:hypothetical protein
VDGDGGSATVVISRKGGGWRDRARAYAVLIDDQLAAKIKHGQRVEVPVGPGRHELHLKISWCSSRSFTFQAGPGEVAEFYCEPGGPASAALGQVLADTDRYIRLTRVS